MENKSIYNKHTNGELLVIYESWCRIEDGKEGKSEIFNDIVDIYQNTKGICRSKARLEASIDLFLEIANRFHILLEPTILREVKPKNIKWYDNPEKIKEASKSDNSSKQHKFRKKRNNK